MSFKPRSILRECLRLLPKSIRYSRYRKATTFPPPPSDLVIRIARTREELEAAFRVLHDAYVAIGLMKPHPSGMRVTLYHSLPSTSTIIALKGSEVVGTVSIIRDSALGFPLDRAFDTFKLRSGGARLAEISSLALASSYRGQKGQILFPLMKYIYEYCDRYFGINHMVMVVHPRAFDFYESILGFERLSENIVKNYSFVEGAPAAAGVLDLSRSAERYAMLYGNAPDDKHLLKYFNQAVFPELHYPNRTYFSISDPVMTPKLLHYFFREKTEIFANMADRERSILQLMYNDPSYHDVLPKGRLCGRGIQAEKRFAVQCEGRIVFEGSGQSFPAVVRDVSRTGVNLRLSKGELRFGEPHRIDIRIADFEVARLIASSAWYSGEGVYGFRILKASDNWHRFIQQLDAELLKKESA